ncbi:GNAT family N-acetyltransferase [Chitinophaga sp. GCM10012297]|uniref:GNAT family N-acetyltransferase n=1 Tax=Chitinophaga chungangae TaxID=2821488 RepID=A0ABS3YAS8_9BACT|nr:GNAT family N-acetyltransferase [Chitinophaga chungangae]MBO9151585.1 GNAT family N-acetyltransferase [Chitinophaga chungangae]
MRIIKATTDHLPQLAVLFDLYRQHYEQQPDVAGAESYLMERLVRNESVIYVAEEGGELIGFTQLYPVFSSIGMKKAWILNDLYVSEQHRRKGAARGLLSASRELGEATDARYLMLQTHTTNEKARALYESNGWKRDDEFYYYYLSI